MKKLNKTEKCLLLLISPAVFFLIYDVFFYWVWILNQMEVYTEELIAMMAFFSVCNILFFYVFSRKLLSLDVSFKLPYDLKPNFLRSISVVLLSIVSVGIVLANGGGWGVSLQQSYAELATRSATPVLINTAIIYGVLYCVFKYKIHIISHGFVFLGLIFSALINGRATVIVWLVVYMVALMRHHSLKFAQSFFIFFVALVFFVASSYSRGTISIDGKDIVLESLDYNQVFTLVETVNYTRQSGPKFHLYIADVVQGFVPRSIYPDKDTSTSFTREVFPWVWEMTSYTSGFYANLIFVFGFVGLLFCPILVYCINKLYIAAISRNKRDCFGQFVAVCLTACPVLLVRGGVFELRIIMTVVLISVGVWVVSLISLSLFRR